ncbi:TerB family tellurite resistance protein [uncultured Planktosalinus sp.]|uniref:TerB family tellurite resistance protein n=1 Tax=uncultured Planktosalinus sp. TaxID=1810935 RepID=UPI0030D7F99F
MSLEDLFSGGSHKRKLGHFSALVNVALVDGPIKPEEELLLLRFARKLDINELEYNEIIKNPKKYPVFPTNSQEIRLKQLHDIFRIIFADKDIDEEEAEFLNRYAIILGFSEADAKKIIDRSIQIFSGGLDFYDYEYLLNKK